MNPKATPIRLLSQLENDQVLVQGFVKVVRDQKRVQFLVVGNRGGSVQAVLEKSPENQVLNEIISSLSVGSAVAVRGKVQLNPSIKLGGLEILIEGIEVASHAEAPLPIDESSSRDLRLDYRWIDLRRPENLLTFEVQTAIETAMRAYWEREGFIEIHSPKLMPSASESGAELFKLKYFDTTAYLAQSPQFYKQMGIAAGFERVFEIGPVFRANPSFTPRHDTEFTSVDMEIGWIESHEDVMEIEEQWLHEVLKTVAEKFGPAIKELFGVDVVVPSLPFPRITLANAREILVKQGHIIEHRGDLDPEGERRLGRHLLAEYGHEFAFITDWPIEIRPFYHMRHENDPTSTKSFDLLWKELEITTGAQREHRLDRLKQQAAEKQISEESIATYLDFFRYGVPPHGGMGVGLTRILMILLNRESVREVTYLFRGPTRLTP